MRYRVLWSFLLLLLSWATAGQAVTRYIDDAGTNNGTCTSSGSPCRTFPYALAVLQPGDVLEVQNGTYTVAQNGMFQITCDINATYGTQVRHGTSALPITVRAQNERQAHLQGTGTLVPLWVRSCNYWTFEGLYLSTTDNPSNSNLVGSDVQLDVVQNVTLRRLLINHGNRYFNGSGIEVLNSSYVLLEENEIYSQIRNAVTVKYSDNITVRRNYGHSRSEADIAGGRVTGDTTRGDSGISCYPCDQSIFENNIMEQWADGFDIAADGSTIGTQWRGNISLTNGFNVFGARQAGLIGMPQNTVMEHHLVVGNGAGCTNCYGIGWRSNKNSRCDHCTILDGVNGSRGIVADDNALGDGNPSVFGTNILIANNAGVPFTITAQDGGWGFDYILAYNNGGAPSPAFTDSHYTHVVSTTQSVDPLLGTCKVFIPAGSPAKGAGSGGSDIGATILYRYQQGALTTTPLWNPTTGAFPCGAIVTGVNDVAGSSCFDVHERLNVNFNGCNLPGGPPSHAQACFP